MPPLPLAKILNVALPSLVVKPVRSSMSLACKNGLLPPAGDVATFLGLRTRHQVARTLRRASLPPLEELAAWTRLFYWVLQWEQTGASLLALARQSRLEPATCYRLVRRLMDNRGRACGAAVRQAPSCAFGRSGKTAACSSSCCNRICRPRCGRATYGRGARCRRRRLQTRFQHSCVRRNSLPMADLVGRPRGVLAARLVITGYPFDVSIAPDGSAWVTRLHAAMLERLQLQRSRPPVSFASGSPRPA